jgi:hypothetical protein
MNVNVTPNSFLGQSLVNIELESLEYPHAPVPIGHCCSENLKLSML